ncbi:MAG: T9SS type A sorting domain-containing protein [Chitinophagaceae bacterium]|nr:T9SS type A sorting domain-containing protein [Chitinophagaceae bacterium]
MKLFPFVLLSLILNQAAAQRNCGTANYWTEQLSSDLQLKTRYERLQKNTPSLKEQENDFSDIAIITIPVVVHVLYNTPAENISDEQIRSQLDVLNKDFSKTNHDISQVPAAFAAFAADTHIQFELAKVDPEGRATTGIVRKKTTQASWKQNDEMKYNINGGDDAWDSRYYLNIWVCNLNRSLLGYSTFPGAAADKDGVVIRTDIFGSIHISHPVYNKGRTTTHEVGHWLNLRHLWGDSNCGDDGVADTPPQRTYNSGCSSFPQVNPDGCNPDPNGDMFMNFMDFSDDACILMFTSGQKQRMRDLFKANGPRSSLLQSPALGEPWNNTPSPYDDPAEQVVLTVFPNPATSGIIFSSRDGKPVMVKTFTVYDNTGRAVLKGSQSSGISIAGLAAGIYFVNIETEKKKTTLKFIKK